MALGINSIRTVFSSLASAPKAVSSTATSVIGRAGNIASEASAKIGKKEYVEYFKKLLTSMRGWGEAAFNFVVKYGKEALNLIKTAVEKLAGVFKQAPKTV